MKKRRSANSSLDLFIDTICNVFGGVIFIALLLAILVQQTVGIIKIPEGASPEEIAKMRQELDQVSAEIASSRVLLETLQAVMPRPQNPAEQERVELFFELSAAKGAAIEKKAELLNQRLAREREMLDWKDRVRTVTTTLQQKQNERQAVNREIEQQQREQRTANDSMADLRSRINELNRQIAQREAVQQRDETIHVPRLRSSGNLERVNLVLRHNRLFPPGVRVSSTDGIPVRDTPTSKQAIWNLLSRGNSRTEFLAIQVFDDSAEQWYVVRDLMVAANFRYQLIPTRTPVPPPPSARPLQPSVRPPAPPGPPRPAPPAPPACACGRCSRCVPAGGGGLVQ